VGFTLLKERAKKGRKNYKTINWGGLLVSLAGVLNDGYFD
jgi:hypothetical protein